MSDWAEGYVADIAYTYGYYGELNPLRSALALLSAGYAPPKIGTACELGFGQGISVNVHAASSAVKWYGTDFNPEQVVFARELADAAGAGAQLFDDSFAEFVARQDLPEFDYIGLHGIWSWISSENQALIIDFVRRKLKVGGVLYISYNTFPGWAGFAPMRHLLTQHAAVLGAPGEGVVGRVDHSVKFAEQLLAAKPAYARSFPQLSNRLEKIKGQDRHYLAHEYFNRDWQPMYFAEMANCLGAAKLGFACSASYTDLVDVLELSDSQQAFLKGIKDRNFQQTVRDFMVNQQFRRDYWIKGGRRLNTLERIDARKAQRVILVTPRQDVPLNFKGAQSEVSFSEAIYRPILDFLSDHRARSIGEIAAEVASVDIKFDQVFQACLILIATAHLAPAQGDDEILAVKERVQGLNAYLLRKAEASGDLGYLASPVTGGGISVNRFHQLFLGALNSGRAAPSEWAEYAWAILDAQGQKLLKDNVLLATPPENLAHLMSLAMIFSEKRLPVLRGLQIL